MPARFRKIASLVSGDISAAIVLILAATASMVLANWPGSPAPAHAAVASPAGALAWLAWWHAPRAFHPVPGIASAADWVNQALMAVFFFTVGLEIKREALAGALATPARRRLPVIAAAAGMAVPAAIYLAIAGGTPGIAQGWPIPCATDIAFALGVLALVGRRLPASLRVFLLAVAVVDDLGAVAIIAIAYGHGFSGSWLLAALAVWLMMFGLARRGVRRGWPYAAMTLLLWFCVCHAGIHATIAGVAGALTIPLKRDRHGHNLLVHMEHRLAPWSAFVILPIFALANAGVPLAGLVAAGPGGVAALRTGLAVALGLVIGKQAGILGAVVIAERLGMAARPPGTTLAQIWGVALIAGVGFTMALFLAELAFPAVSGASATGDMARLGIFAGSLLSALAGWAVLRRAR